MVSAPPRPPLRADTSIRQRLRPVAGGGRLLLAQPDIRPVVAEVGVGARQEPVRGHDVGLPTRHRCGGDAEMSGSGGIIAKATSCCYVR